MSADPAGPVDGVNLYVYVSDNPVRKNVNFVGKYRCSALASAAVGGHYRVVELLLSRGANAHGGSKEKKKILSPLREAALRGHLEVTRILLQHGADPNDVLSAGIGFLVKIDRQILTELIDAGGAASKDLLKILDGESRINKGTQ